ncbi:MAG: 16S rRNA (adenine(1518)-N(6)/adenine(1519)-N(6))-dimethyltransferase RsmA [Betaproteobacteria bacterium]|nr:MAG: 16S rRNA (adenine(1518)-N(6)/adenine(1519)-N(6))-dimethyltransferase RsmA [Betaproteobacteria bacterium]
MKHVPRKRFGQHFLTDQTVIADIVAAIRPQPDDAMVEIGPGLGALTTPLAAVLRHLHVIEIDRDINARLSSAYPGARLTVHAGDVLDFDFSSLPRDLRVVGNLPYNISTPLLFHLARYAGQVRDMHFMLQKEVVERMVAAPGGGDFGRLSVMLQYRFEMEMLLEVAPDAFSPPPQVRSAVVRLRPRALVELIATSEAMLALVVRRAFSQRRKTLRNSLADLLEAGDFAALGIASGLRAERLAVADFVGISNYLEKKNKSGAE